MIISYQVLQTSRRSFHSFNQAGSDVDERGGFQVEVQCLVLLLCVSQEGQEQVLTLWPCLKHSDGEQQTGGGWAEDCLKIEKSAQKIGAVY